MSDKIKCNIQNANNVISYLTATSSVKFNSKLHSITTQLVKSNDFEAMIGSVELEGLAELTDEFIGNIKSMLNQYIRNQEQLLNNIK